METMKVVGFRAYKGEYEGHPYSGYMLFCVKESDRPDVQGCEVEIVKAKEKLGYHPVVGDTIAVHYNKYGICAIEVL